ncbi:hypothetical protein THRCLA_00278 [Thraustotheca clavata]|uniref:Uncharacterized protein n=1 Tax=Thraustotheca clavata TaxID=74557 RepID=A0A1W0ABS0_9STRA|nr:hypothetical protein THRCLA_00278 [Thraustotheca clavata]
MGRPKSESFAKEGEALRASFGQDLSLFDKLKGHKSRSSSFDEQRLERMGSHENDLLDLKAINKRLQPVSKKHVTFAEELCQVQWEDILQYTCPPTPIAYNIFRTRRVINYEEEEQLLTLSWDHALPYSSVDFGAAQLQMHSRMMHKAPTTPAPTTPAPTTTIAPSTSPAATTTEASATKSPAIAEEPFAVEEEEPEPITPEPTEIPKAFGQASVINNDARPNQRAKAKKPTMVYATIGILGVGVLCVFFILRRRRATANTPTLPHHHQRSQAGAYAKISNPHDPYDDVDDMDWDEDGWDEDVPATPRKRMSPDSHNPFSRSRVDTETEMPAPLSTPRAATDSAPIPAIPPPKASTPPPSTLNQPINPFAINHDVFSEFGMVPQVAKSTPPPLPAPAVDTKPSNLFSMEMDDQADASGWDDDDWAT